MALKGFNIEGRKPRAPGPSLRETEREFEALAKEVAEPDARSDGDEKLSQSCGKVEPQPEPKLSQQVEPNLGQSRGKVEPNVSQENEKLSQSRGKVETQLRTEVEPKVEPKVEPTATFSMLVGLQRKVVIFVFESSKFSLDRRTDPIAIQHLAEATKTTVAGARKAIQRLEQKGILRRAEYKDGRGGWTRYELAVGVFHELLSTKSWAKVEPKVEPQLRTELEPSLLSSSSKELNLSSSTTTRKIGAADWSPDEIDLCEFEAIGLNRGHLAQLAVFPEITREALIRSLAHFHATLFADKGRSIRKPVANFLSVMKSHYYYAAPDGYAQLARAGRAQFERDEEDLYSQRKGAVASLDGQDSFPGETEEV